MIVSYKCSLPSVLIIIFRKRIIPKSKIRAHLVKAAKILREILPRLASSPIAKVCQSFQLENFEEKKWVCTWIILCSTHFEALFNGLILCIWEKDYRLENEIRRSGESSLGNMNKTEPEVKLSGLPFFQSCPLEYTLIKLFRSVPLFDLFLDLSDPSSHIS